MSGTKSIEMPNTGSTKPIEVDITLDDVDLEDGEIDDGEDDGQITSVKEETKCTEIENAQSDGPAQISMKIADTLPAPVIIDLSNESSTFTTLTPSKSKKSQLVDDDHASNIENAIASVLKKKGISPPMPKILEMRADLDNKTEPAHSSGHGQSRSSRRRKRKKQRNEKDRKEKKKYRLESPEQKSTIANLLPNVPTAIDNEDEVDDYEMLNVRGGSPPPISNSLLPSALMPMGKESHYDSAVDSCSSYDSYDSELQRYEGRRAAGGGNKSSKESRKSRRERARARDECDDRNGRAGEKRTRRESPSDDKQHRGLEPRKLELCKFYLMECCAKKDKCSYMHSDFPCKYYYLGMECVFGSLCKFSHGGPLTEELRNILLKHLETAPKEILGSFKRICRDTAITQIATRHSELCKEFNVENVLSSLPTNNQNNTQYSRGGSGSNSDHNQHLQQQHQQQQVQNNQLQSTSLIPSLLDIVIKPPTDNSGMPKEKQQRKSRWCDGNDQSSAPSNNAERPCNNTSSSLGLKDLKCILSAEQIEKLSHLGIVNLEEVNQLTFGQLNKIGLTIAEISEIQVNAINIAKSSNSDAQKCKKDKSHINRDVDMRFLPSGSSRKETSSREKEITVSSNSNSNSSNSGVVLVDYSQYLKDSNLSFDRGDLLDDEKDEEQLVIDDDDNLDAEDNFFDANSVDVEHLEESESRTGTGIKLNTLQQIPEKRGTVQSSPKNSFCYSSSFKHQNTKATPKSRDDVGHVPISCKADNSSNPFQEYNSDDNSSESSRIALNRFKDRACDVTHDSRSSRSRSATPTRFSHSSESPEPRSPERVVPSYERPSMYDYFTSKYDDTIDLTKSTKADKDMRLSSFQDSANSDIDLRLPFQPVTNYIPATEIDASITSHSHILYKVYECDVPRPEYTELRQNFTATQTYDPRLRRILGMPELSKTNTAAALCRSGRSKPTSSSTISSPEIEGSSPCYYIPSTSSATSNCLSIHSEAGKDSLEKINKTAAAIRLDPRRAAVATTTSAPSTLSAISNTKPNASSDTAQRQNIEIRNLLQKSDWYKNLNSKFKIMVNQQLALVSTELKKFHLDASPDKVFDIQFIVGNPYLQQILTNLGIYIDDNGKVAYVENDHDPPESKNFGTVLNFNHMPPNIQQQPQMDFLRGPPPNMPPIGSMPNMYSRPSSQHLGMSAFAGSAGHSNPPILPNNNRPSLLGMPPINATNIRPFNPFSNVGIIEINNASGFSSAPGPNAGLVAGPGFAGFGCIGAGPGMPIIQRNFNNQRNNRLQQTNRRNNSNFGSKGNSGIGSTSSQRLRNHVVNSNNNNK